MFTDFRDVRPIFDAVRAVCGRFDFAGVKALDGAIAAARAAQDDKPIFDAARAMDDDGRLDQGEVALIAEGLAAARQGWAHLPPLVASRQIGPSGLTIVKRFEGLELKAYKCPAGVWTIGYGSTGPHVTPGKVITEATADALLQADLDRFEEGVAQLAPGATQGQFDAMVSLAFNIGLAAFRKSTVLRRHLAGDHAGAAAAFALWDKAGGRVLAGLQRRRAEEARLYRSGR